MADPQTEQLARAHFVSGVSYFDQGRYDRALEEFNEAHRVSGRAAFLYNIGVCHERLGHREAAIEAYEQYLAAEPNAAERATTLERIRVLRASAPKAEPPPTAKAQPVLVPASPAVASSPPPERRKRRWIWGVVGGAAALAVAGVVIGVVVSERDTTRTLPDLRPQ